VKSGGYCAKLKEEKARAKIRALNGTNASEKTDKMDKKRETDKLTTPDINESWF
jgi:hypothetical protein